MRRWTTFTLLVFSLHFAWEMFQGKWFASMQGLPFWQSAWRCTRATLGDLVITAVAFGIAALVARSTTWPAGPAVTIGAATFVGVGITITALYEVFALSTGRWSYGPTMPTIFGIGALPLLQWLLLPLLEVGLFRLVWRPSEPSTRETGSAPP